MAYKYDLDSSEFLLKEAFRKTQLEFIDNYVKSILDTEDFSRFSKYTKNLVIEYFRAFLNRLVSNIWLYFADGSNTNLEHFFKAMTVLMSKQLTRVKNLLLEKNLVSDMMTDGTVKHKLEAFFEEYEDRAEFNKAQKGYISVKQQFEDIISLTKAYRGCGEDMIKNAEDLMETYLQYKAAIFKGMGFDVVLEYFSIDNFNFIYKDKRLQDPAERAKYEQIAMNAALKAAMPGFAGDVSVFDQAVEGA